jgi:hypothetical protein
MFIRERVIFVSMVTQVIWVNMFLRKVLKVVDVKRFFLRISWFREKSMVLMPRHYTVCQFSSLEFI